MGDYPEPYGASLRPFKPSLRDRLAAMLMGESKSAERHNFVEGLMGSTGLGNTGPGPGGSGLVDYLPGGQIFPFEEAVQGGDAQGAGLAIMPLPGSKGVGRLIDDALPRPQALANKLRAYHGSPHDFDKFDISKIGTGEGAQAYGHGLYFAESEDVARSYRDTLSNSQTVSTVTPRGQALYAVQNFGDDAAPWLEMKLRSTTDDRLRQRYEEALHLVRDGGVNPGGRMYEVEIDADPNAFLDWDNGGEAIYRGAVDQAEANRSALKSKYGDEALFLSPTELARREFVEQGVPGIKYLDAGSRGAGDGSRNYVTFSDDIVKILRKYGVASIAALPPAIQLAIRLGQEPEQDESY